MWRWFTSLGALGKTAVVLSTAAVVGGGATATVVLTQSGNGPPACLPDMAYTTRTAQEAETALFWRVDCGRTTISVRGIHPLDVSVSPDGQQVAYTDIAPEFDSGLDEPTGPRELYDLGPVTTDTLSLTPDGRFAVLSRTVPGSGDRLWAYSLETARVVDVTSAPLVRRPVTVANDWHGYYGMYEAETLPGEPSPAAAVGIHAVDLDTGADQVAVPGESIQSLDVARTGAVAQAPPVFTRAPLVPLTFVPGDSFTSGEGNPPFEAGTDVVGPANQRNLCHRSNDAFARVLERTGKIRLQAFVACSGATTQDLTERSQYPTQPPQLSTLGRDTELVVLTIGGNDMGFDSLAGDCLTLGCAIAEPKVESQLILLQRVLLPQTFKEIRARVGEDARVLVLGYPRMLPDPNRVDISGCADAKLEPFGPLQIGAIERVRQIVERLNSFTETATDQSGVTFVKADGFFGGMSCAPLRRSSIRFGRYFRRTQFTRCIPTRLVSGPTPVS